MNLKPWKTGHTIGLIIGFLNPMIIVPLFILIYAQLKNFYFSQLWFKFINDPNTSGKFISLAIISNLIWFYIFLNKEKYPQAMGIILGSVLYIPYIVYVTLF